MPMSPRTCALPQPSRKTRMVGVVRSVARHRRARIAILALAVLVPVSAAAQTCSDAATTIERSYGLPTGLLHAIAAVESGHSIGQAGIAEGWPWATNARGEDHYWDSADQAISAVRELQQSGTRSIDVGCFQINLMQHPTAFPNLEHAFDPIANGAAAADFLLALKREAGTWDDAIMRYHSASAELGPPYRDRVLAVWRNYGSVPVDTAPPTFVHVWTPWSAMQSQPAGRGLPTVISPKRVY